MTLAQSPKANWIDAGFRALSAGGPEAVRVEVLAKSLGVTKGGFYWHFDGRLGLLEEMLDTWERRAVDNAIELVEEDGGDARARLRRLFALASSLPGEGFAVELAIRDWARREKSVARRVKRVDNRRVEYLRALFGGFCRDEEEVEARSLLTMTLWVGSSFIVSDHGGRSRGETVELALEWLLR